MFVLQEEQMYKWSCSCPCREGTWGTGITLLAVTVGIAWKYGNMGGRFQVKMFAALPDRTEPLPRPRNLTFPLLVFLHVLLDTAFKILFVVMFVISN
jgi:hypothetical protein